MYIVFKALVSTQKKSILFRWNHPVARKVLVNLAQRPEMVRTPGNINQRSYPHGATPELLQVLLLRTDVRAAPAATTGGQGQHRKVHLVIHIFMKCEVLCRVPPSLKRVCLEMGYTGIPKIFHTGSQVENKAKPSTFQGFALASSSTQMPSMRHVRKFLAFIQKDACGARLGHEDTGKRCIYSI